MLNCMPLALVLAAALPAKAEERPPPAHELTESDVAAFLDGIVPQQLAREDIAGATVAVVQGGRVLFARGYGWADVEAKTRVSAETTLVRPGSVSKLFTWTAVMQLVEQGRLELNRDINQYLDFPIPKSYPQPITLAHLLTHTAGFEEVIDDLGAERPEDLRPLGEYLRTHLPRRIYAPGTVPAYSNYGAALAGYIVERVAGVPFAQYVRQHIFAPLGMAHSTFVQPLPAELAPLMSKGYRLASKPPRPFELVQPAPAGSLSTTAADLARFMIAHLQDGAFGEARILEPATARTMHARQFGLVPDMNGMAYGFYEESRNGQRIIGHAGDTVLFHSDLHLLPGTGVGFFVSYNSGGSSDVSVRRALWQAFLDRYFPAPSAAASVAGASASAVAGSYLSSRRVESNLFSLFAQPLPLEVDRDGRISMPQLVGPNGKPLPLHPVSPMQYASDEGDRRIAFVRAADGGLTLVPEYPFFVFQRVPWYAGRGMVVALFAFVQGMFQLALLSWPIAALVRRHYGRPLRLEPGDRRLRLAVRIAAAAVIAVFVGWVLFFVAGSRDIALFGTASRGWVLVLQVSTSLAALASLTAVVHAVRCWRRPGTWIWTRIFETGIGVAALGFVWIVLRYHLLNSGPTF